MKLIVFVICSYLYGSTHPPTINVTWNLWRVSKLGNLRSLKHPMDSFPKVIPYDDTSHYPPWHKPPLKAHFQVTESHQRLRLHIIITNKLDFVQFVACRAEAHQGRSCASARRCDRERRVRLWITKPLIWADTSLIGTNGGGWPLPTTSTDLPFYKRRSWGCASCPLAPSPVFFHGSQVKRLMDSAL